LKSGYIRATDQNITRYQYITLSGIKIDCPVSVSCITDRRHQEEASSSSSLSPLPFPSTFLVALFSFFLFFIFYSSSSFTFSFFHSLASLPSFSPPHLPLYSSPLSSFYPHIIPFLHAHVLTRRTVCSGSERDTAMGRAGDH
jgi:hypothetical protein